MIEPLEGRRLLTTTSVFDYYGPHDYQTMAPGITANLQGNRIGNSPYSNPYSLDNDTVTLTLGGLQAHQMVRVDAETQFSSYYEGPAHGTSSLAVDFAGRHQVETHVPGGSGSGGGNQGGFGWVLHEAGPDGSLTVTLTGSDSSAADHLYLFTIDVDLYLPTVSMTSNATTVSEENETRATITVSRDLPGGYTGGPIDERVPELNVPLLYPSDTSDFYAPPPGTVTIPTGSSVSTFTLRAKDDALAEGHPVYTTNTNGEVTTGSKRNELFAMELQESNSGRYTLSASQKRVTLTIIDGSAWYYSNWYVKSAPQMRTTPTNVGQEIAYKNGSSGNRLKYVRNYYSYEEWVPLYEKEAISHDFGLTASTTLTWTTQKETAWSFSLSAENGGTGGVISFQFLGVTFSSSTGEEKSQTFTGPVSGVDEMAMVVPLVREKVFYVVTDQYRSSGGQWIPGTMGAKTELKRGKIGPSASLFSKAVFAFNREWLDPDDSQGIQGRTTSYYLGGANSIFDHLLGRDEDPVP